MNLIEQDKKVNWHPFTQMQTAPDPIPMVRGDKEFLFDEQGNRWIDAISSWWVTVHGHAHPYMAQKIYEQASTLDHVIFAHFTHPKVVELSTRLLEKVQLNQVRCFYSDNGSTSVEVGLKMAIQAHYNQGQKRLHFFALEGAYHGDTFGAMAVGERSVFSAPFDDLLFDVTFLPVPTEENIGSIKQQIDEVCQTKDVAGFVYEPLVQGTAGMRMYSAELLQEMMVMMKERNVLCIADEVFVGFGRTGKMFASHYMDVHPDIMCFSKGLTGGIIALGITSCTQEVYDRFLSEDSMKTFFHGHSYTANPIACSAGCASLDLFEQEKTLERIAGIHNQHLAFIDSVKDQNHISCRTMGSILAVEFKVENGGYFNDLAGKVHAFFKARYLLVRPLGNIIYLVPPACISKNSLNELYEAFRLFIEEVKDEI